MAKMSDLKNIRNEIAEIADEKNVLAEWGETYEELPLPSVEDVLDSGVDNILGVLDSVPPQTAQPPSSATHKQTNAFDDAISTINVDTPSTENTTTFPEVPEDFLSDVLNPNFDIDIENEIPAPPTKDSNLNSDSDFEINDALFDTTDFNSDEPHEETSLDVENTETTTQYDPDINFDIDDFGTKPIDDEFSTSTPSDDFDLTAFDEGLSSLDIEATETPSTDENIPDRFFDIDDTVQTDGFESFDNQDSLSISPDKNADNEFSIDADTLKFDDTTEVGEPFTDSFTDARTDSSATTSDFSDVADFGDFDFTDASFSDSDFSFDDSFQGDSTSSTVQQDFSQDFDLSSDFDASGEIPEVEDAYTPVDTLDNVEVPEMDEKTDFTKKGDSFAGGFAPPEKFETFADDNASHSSYTVHRQETVSESDIQDGVPLSITEKDFQRFLQILDGMPLNLRKEIQHYIAYDKDSEVNKMKLVDLMVKGSSINKVVKYLEETLNKSIKIPKGFDKKSFEEFEQEKKTFKYKLRYKILPIVSISAIITVLVCSIFVIAWQFIYKPLMAESYYRDGVYYIENGLNNTAIEKFDKAGTYWKKKRWYFTYATKFREKKQYSSAESMYLRLLTDFNHDVKGGIAYADMLATELRDYQKAETVLRRQVIDYHPDSNEAFYALGNVYLEWGLENDSKLVEAEKIFTQLLLKDGGNDAYNAGLMKYYIRTDNLEKVLPSKDFFLEKGRSISVDDLAELGGYLLTCRYEPSPKVSLALKNKIDDLRELLERAIKMDETHADANYNLGRFFIYNYKPSEAEFYLERAIQSYGNEILPLSRFLKKLDAMRLYGEVLVERNQYLEAETVFSNALSLYRTYNAVSPLPANKTVGKLFEDYGDIKYFIAGDYEMALDTYTKATTELVDTASVRYKIGYIQYHFGNYDQAATEFALASLERPNDTNVLFALGNALFKRANYSVAQAYYERLLETLDAEKLRRGVVLPQVRESDGLFVETYMRTTNNLGVTLNRLAVQTGNSEMNSRSFMLFAESTRAWDALTRNPETLIRVKNQQAPAYVNVHYMSAPNVDFVPEIYTDIPRTIENDKVLREEP